MIVSDGDVGDNAKYFLALRDVPRHPGISKAFIVSPEEAQGRVPVVIKAKDINVLDYDVADPAKREIEFDVIATVASEVVSSFYNIKIKNVKLKLHISSLIISFNELVVSL